MTPLIIKSNSLQTCFILLFASVGKYLHHLFQLVCMIITSRAKLNVDEYNNDCVTHDIHYNLDSNLKLFSSYKSSFVINPVSNLVKHEI